jgi:transposase
LHRWRKEAGQAGREIKRIAVAYEAGRDGFWLARWLRARDVEVYVIHPTSIAVSREHRRAKTGAHSNRPMRAGFAENSFRTKKRPSCQRIESERPRFRIAVA